MSLKKLATTALKTYARSKSGGTAARTRPTATRPGTYRAGVGKSSVERKAASVAMKEGKKILRKL